MDSSTELSETCCQVGKNLMLMERNLLPPVPKQVTFLGIQAAGLACGRKLILAAATLYFLLAFSAIGQTISINNTSITEGNTGTTAAVFTVNLDQASANTVTVDYSTADGSGIA